MKSAKKKATIYFDYDLHRALRSKAAHTKSNVSDLVNDAVRASLGEDILDITAFAGRKHVKSISFNAVTEKLKSKQRYATKR